MSDIAKDLEELLNSRDYDVETLDSKTGKPPVDAQTGEPDPEAANVFQFDYVGSSGKNYGIITILLGAENTLELYSSDYIGRTMDPEDKDEWFEFLQQLKNFAIRNFRTFKNDSVNRMKYSLRGQAHIKESLFESYYGNRKVSYSGLPTDARLMIKHNKVIGENDRRYLYVESLFIETAAGERFKLPFRRLSGGRAMLEHVRKGGNPYDLRGQHICEIVEELNVLARFNRANKGKIFEGETLNLVTEAEQYYKTLNHNLKSLGSSTGYKKYFESWSPAEISTGNELANDLKQMFIEQSIDSRIEQALPLLAKIKQGNTMKQADIFENWVNSIVEDVQSMPDTPEKQENLVGILTNELPVGPDATNATEALMDVFLTKELVEELKELADQDPDADAREIVYSHLEQNSDDPHVKEIIAVLGTEQETVDQDDAKQNDVGQADANQDDASRDQVDEADITNVFEGEMKNLVNNFMDDLEYSEWSGKPLYKNEEHAMRAINDILRATQYSHLDQDIKEQLRSYAMQKLGHWDADFNESKCSMTAEGKHCPVHGLEECYGEGVYKPYNPDNLEENRLNRLRRLAGVEIDEADAAPVMAAGAPLRSGTGDVVTTSGTAPAPVKAPGQAPPGQAPTPPTAPAPYARANTQPPTPPTATPAAAQQAGATANPAGAATTPGAAAAAINLDYGTPTGAGAPGTTATTSAPAAKAPAVSQSVADIAKASGIADPNKIQVGQKVTLPDGSEYTVAKGDTLSAIAAGKRKANTPGATAQRAGMANTTQPWNVGQQGQSTWTAAGGAETAGGAALGNPTAMNKYSAAKRSTDLAATQGEERKLITQASDMAAQKGKPDVATGDQDAINQAMQAAQRDKEVAAFQRGGQRDMRPVRQGNQPTSESSSDLVRIRKLAGLDK
jgi:hypothetical protein